MSWDRPGLAEWWRGELERDPAYARDVDTMLESLLPVPAPGPILDLGCGDGRLLGAVEGAVGVDSAASLLATAVQRGPVVCGDLLDLPIRDAAAGGAVAVLVLEHIPNIEAVLAEAGRVVRQGGFLVAIANHPVFTAPESAPVLDDDGEALWRWGQYFEDGWTDEPTGEHTLRFHHRSLGALLGAASAVGWDLEEMREAPTGDRTDPLLARQAMIPRLLGVRWRRR